MTDGQQPPVVGDAFQFNRVTHEFIDGQAKGAYITRRPSSLPSPLPAKECLF